MSYKLLVDDNARYMDEGARYTHGEYETAAEARVAACALVERDLAELHRPGMSADELYRHYTTFGADPSIVPADETTRFSAWDYARARCRELCRRTEDD